MIKFLTKVTPGISSQNNLIVNIKNGEKLPRSTSCSRCRLRLQTAVATYIYPLSLAQPFHPLPHVRRPSWQGCVPECCLPCCGFFPHPLLWPQEIQCWKLAPICWRVHKYSYFWCLQSQSLLADSPPLQMVSAHFSKYCRTSLYELVDCLVNLILSNKYSYGTYGISPCFPEILSYFVIYFLSSVPWKTPQSAKIDPDLLASIQLLACTQNHQQAVIYSYQVGVG